MGRDYEVRFYVDDWRTQYQTEYTCSFWTFAKLMFKNRKRLIYFKIYF